MGPNNQSVFFTLLNLFGKDPEETKPYFDFSVPQKVLYGTCRKLSQDARY